MGYRRMLEVRQRFDQARNLRPLRFAAQP